MIFNLILNIDRAVATFQPRNHLSNCCNCRTGLSHAASISQPHVPAGAPSLMTISTPLQSSHPSFIKMEDRKRSAGDDLAPPTKRQAVNGKASADSDMPWAADLEVCHCHILFITACMFSNDMSLFQFFHPFCLQDVISIQTSCITMYDLSGWC